MKNQNQKNSSENMENILIPVLLTLTRLLFRPIRIRIRQKEKENTINGTDAPIQGTEKSIQGTESTPPTDNKNTDSSVSKKDLASNARDLLSNKWVLLLVLGAAAVGISYYYEHAPVETFGADTYESLKTSTFIKYKQVSSWLKDTGISTTTAVAYNWVVENTYNTARNISDYLISFVN